MNNREELHQDLAAATMAQLANALGVYAFAVSTFDWPEEITIGMALKMLDELFENSNRFSSVEKDFVDEAKSRTEAAIIDALKTQRQIIGQIKQFLPGENDKK